MEGCKRGKKDKKTVKTKRETGMGEWWYTKYTRQDRT